MPSCTTDSAWKQVLVPPPDRPRAPEPKRGSQASERGELTSEIRSRDASPAKSRLPRLADLKIVSRLWPFLRRQKVLGGCALFLLAPIALLQLTPPYLLKLAIDRALVPGRLDRLGPVVALLVLVLISEQVLVVAQTLLLQLCGQRAMYLLRIRVHRHLLTQGMGYFDRTPIGGPVTRATNDIESIAEAFTSGVVALVGDLIKLLGIAAIMIFLDWGLALCSFAVIPPLMVTAIFFQRLLRDAYRKARRHLAKINAFLQEQLDGMKIVQLFGQQRRSAEKFSVLNARYRDAFKDAIRFDATLFALVEMLGSVAVALVLFVGGSKVVQGASLNPSGNPMTFGLLVAFVEYLQRFFQPIRDLSAKYAIMQQAMASAERVFALLDHRFPDAPSREPPAVSRDKEPLLNPKIAFESVLFTYDRNAEPVFDGLCLQVKRGEKVAIVGPTGAGKSTIARLISRQYEIQGGSLRIDGVDIRDLAPSELRRRALVVGQEPFLFTGNVRDNISLGSFDADAKAIRIAAERASLPSRLELDAPVGERGKNLSFGERQLIALARAFLRDPEILILDEATASVDPWAEELIQQSASELLEGRTSIIIAHRLATIEDADRIVVLSRGQIIEEGEPRQLLQRSGAYAQLHRLQYI